MSDSEDPYLFVEINGHSFAQCFEGNDTPLNRNQLNVLIEKLCFYPESEMPTIAEMEAGVILNFGNYILNSQENTQKSKELGLRLM